VKINGYFGEICRLLLHDQKVSQARDSMELIAYRALPISRFVKMKVAYSSDTSVALHLNTQHSIPEDGTM
jgi:hypothetical protein